MVKEKFYLKNVNKLFTVLETDSTLTFHRKRIKPGSKSHNTLANFLIDSTMVNSNNNALEFISNKISGNYLLNPSMTDKMHFTIDILRNHFLPHCGTNFYDKVYFLSDRQRKPNVNKKPVIKKMTSHLR